MRLKGRIALVTGASRGIGRAVALKFAEEGAHVVSVARNREGLESLDDSIRQIGGQSTLVPLDVTDGSGLDRLAENLFNRHGRLDILVGNAANLGVLGPVWHVTPNVWDRVINVNLSANWNLIKSFDPLLRASSSGRVVFVTSRVGHDVIPYWGPYAVSKAGLEMLARLYAEETKQSNIRVNIVDPGAVRTSMRATAMPGEDPNSLPLPAEIADLFVDLSSPEFVCHGGTINAQGKT